MRKGLLVLLVDDDDLVRASVRRMLGLHGAEVTDCDSGQEALDRLAAGEAFDLVLLDMNMPGLSGAQTLVRIRELRPELPVILATGLPDEAAAAAQSTSAVVVLEKPFRAEQLSQALARSSGSGS